MNRTFDGSMYQPTKSLAQRFMKSSSRNFNNGTGPGDYETRSGFGWMSESKKVTSPSFSMKIRTKGNVVSKYHYQDWVSKDTPGAGSYEAKRLDKGKAFAVPGDMRFRRPKLATDKAPHTFEKKTTLSTIGCGIPHDERWHYGRETKSLEKRAPGPGTYESRTIFTRQQQRMYGLGRIKRFEEKSIDAAVAKDFRMKETPGPGEYSFDNGWKQNQKFKMGKMSPPSQSKKFRGGVVQYGDYHAQQIKAKRKAANATFGSAK